MFVLASPLPLPLVFTSVLLIVSTVAFIGWFVRPAVLLRSLLKSVLSDLQRNKSANPHDLLTNLGKIFAKDAKLKHLWSEFAETLHRQEETENGITRVCAVRSTQPSETYFNSQYVIDGCVRLEFFRHLPGILTGVGIIGTFSGLIGGLQEFQAGLAPADAAAGTAETAAAGAAMAKAISSLLQEVSTAFYVSATAIGLAMAATTIEKLLITSLYQLIEEIAQRIDEQFAAGAGEEYLARLVNASEDSASQAKILKDSLVNDLKEVLREITERQISASTQGNTDLGNRIVSSISEGLSDPLATISNSVRAAAGDQSATAARLMQDAMAGFSAQLSDLFGGQFEGIAALNTNAAENMTAVVQTLNRLVAGIEVAATRSTDTMSAQIAAALVRMDEHQRASNEQTAAFIEQLRKLVAQSQTETNEKMQETISALGARVSEMIGTLNKQNTETSEEHRKRENETNGLFKETVGSMQGSVEIAAKEMAESSRLMQSAVGELTRVTTSALDRMMQGANTLHGSSTEFAAAGTRVSGVIAQVNEVASKFSGISGAMTAGAEAMQSTIADYKQQRYAIVSVLEELKALVDGTRRDVALTSDIVTRMESSAAKLSEAQAQVSDYMGGVGAVLIEAQDKFADATVKTLDRVNQDFHKQMATAVKLLSSSISEFEATLASVGAKQ
jgi:hypothetical protein